MRSGARSGSDGSTSVEAGRRVGASMKSRLAQPPRIVGVFGALRPSVRARWVWRELYANYPSARHGWDGAEQWPWADRSISNRRKPRDSDRDVPSCVVTYPYPAKNISNLVPWHFQYSWNFPIKFPMSADRHENKTKNYKKKSRHGRGCSQRPAGGPNAWQPPQRAARINYE